MLISGVKNARPHVKLDLLYKDLKYIHTLQPRDTMMAHDQIRTHLILDEKVRKMFLPTKPLVV